MHFATKAVTEMQNSCEELTHPTEWFLHRLQVLTTWGEEVNVNQYRGFCKARVKQKVNLGTICSERSHKIDDEGV